jgi:hypothetical protein
LRQHKTTDLGTDIPPTSMPAVRQVLDELRKLAAPIWKPGNDSALFTDGVGHIYLKRPDGLQNLDGQLGAKSCWTWLRRLKPAKERVVRIWSGHGPSYASCRASLAVCPTWSVRGTRPAPSRRW